MRDMKHQPQTAASTLRTPAHNSPASRQRICSHNSIQQRETVSQTDARSHKQSNVPALSNTSSGSTLSDDAKSDIKSIEERPTRQYFWFTSSNVGDDFEKESDYSGEAEIHERRIRYRPRMIPSVRL